MQSRAGILGGKKTPEGRLHPGAAEEASAKKPRTITIVPSRHIRIWISKYKQSVRRRSDKYRRSFYMYDDIICFQIIIQIDHNARERSRSLVADPGTSVMIS